MPAGESLELLRAERKEVIQETKGTAAQSKRILVGDGLELLRGTKESQSKDKVNRGENQRMSVEEGLELVHGIKGSHSGDEGHRQE